MSTEVGLRNVSYDDRDPSLKYQGSWFLKGTFNASSVHQSGTLSSTNVPGADVTFTFPQAAVAFYYYGIKRSLGGNYSICVDCDPNNRIFVNIDGVNRTDDGRNPPVVLFSTTFPTPVVHEIILRNEQDSRFNGNSQMTIDKFDLEIVDPDAVPPTQSPSSQSTMLSSFSTATTATTPSTTSSTTPSQAVSTPASKPSAPIGIIVGAVLGGLAAVFCIVIVLLWICMMQRRAASPRGRDYEGNQTNFEQYPTPRRTSRAPSEKRGSSRGGAQSQNSTAWTYPSSSSSGNFASAASSSRAPITRPPVIQTQATPPGRRRAEDAGPIPQLQVHEEESDDILPPDYGDVFSSGRSV